MALVTLQRRLISTVIRCLAPVARVDDASR
jgi:hypothetical protein